MSPLSSPRAGRQEGGSHVYLLNCSVCKGEFLNRQKWLEHLTLDFHQKLARECLQENMNSLRECSLVIFTTYDLTVEWAVKIIQFFGKDQSIWVTDFLWGEGQPRFAVIQFESRKKAEEVLLKLESFPGAVITIGSQDIQMKRAFDLLDLEWKALLPGSYPSPLVPPKSFQKSAKESEATETAQKDKDLGKSNEEVDNPKNISVGDTNNHTQKAKDENSSIATNNPVVPTTDTNPIAVLTALSQKLCGISPKFKVSQISNKRKYFCRVILNGNCYTPRMSVGSVKTAEEAKEKAAQFCLESLKKQESLTAQECVSPSQSHLSHQFTVISQFVEIPDEKCEQVLEIVKSFRDVLRNRVPSAQVIIFRNWYLKLRNSSSQNEPLLLYIYAENGIPDIGDGPPPPPSDENFTWLPGRFVQQAINQCDELFLRLEEFPEPDDPKETRLGCKFQHKPSGFKFVVVNFKRTMVEVQISRLVKYFCEFDPRIRPLLILARYWLITNGIHWGEPEVTGRTSHQCLPEPHPLDWMILTFLMGEKYVPSVRSILERPHKVVIERATVTDLGFSADGDFSREWKREKGVKADFSEHFILETLHMFQSFLEYCCTQIFTDDSVIINPKDGEILETSGFLKGKFTSKLTPQEISVLKKFQQNSDKKEKGNYCVDFRKWNWYMIHPLITSWRFSVPGMKRDLATIRITRRTNKRLKNLLKLVEKEGPEKAFEICGASLCEILEVHKTIAAVDLDPVPSSPSRKRPIDLIKNPEDEGPSTNKKAKIKNGSTPTPTLVTLDLEKSPPPSKGNETSLVCQLYNLLEEFVVIPDDQFNKVLEAVNFLKTIFFQSHGSNCKVSLFRSWNLKLKTVEDEPEDMPLLVVYKRQLLKGKQTGILLPPKQVSTILKAKKMKKKISVLEVANFKPTNTMLSRFIKGWTLECKGFGGDDDKTFKLCLFSSDDFIFEGEISNLLKYMCKFDGRAYQMIKMAYFWMGLNGLTIGHVGDKGGGASSLQWLVIFWMCHRKMVPSPREIQERGTHKVLRDGGTGVDLGWKEDKHFLEEWREGRKDGEFKWREDCVVGLLEGFREFLEFFGGFVEDSETSWILDTRNGELIEMKKFLDSDYSGGDWDKCMSGEEIGMLRNQLVKFKMCKVYMIHPLNIQWKLGLRYDMGYLLRVMKAGGARLKTYLNVRKFYGAKEAKKRFISLKHVLTLTDVDLEK